MVEKEKETFGKKTPEGRNVTEEHKEQQQAADNQRSTDHQAPENKEQPGYNPSEIESPPAKTTDLPEKPGEAQVATAAVPEHAGNQIISPAADHTLAEDNVKDIDQPDEATTPRNQADENHHDEEEEDEEEHVDYSHLSKRELVQHAEELVKAGNWRKADKEFVELKHHFDEMLEADKQEALDKFIQQGGEEADFEYRLNDLDQRFEAAFRRVKEEKSRHFADQQRTREQNLAHKNEILARLRDFVDAEETNTSLKDLKKLQDEWKAIGPVPPQYNSNLWANYNALLDMFYNNRSILYELKELDRRKNLETKTEIVERAEKLLNYENMKDATRELRELHEEFKHVGPVPREEQEPLWQRFKEASDKIYEKRRAHLDRLNSELEGNLLKKRELGDRVQEFLEFSSDRITEWNDKTKELLNLQKDWDAIGGLPRQVAKEVNKYFWSAFKGFFGNKNKFFKELEKKREENLKLKEVLVQEAESLKDSDDWQKTANRFKELQRRWKEIGPVPEKQRDEVYKKFKAAADSFFENKRIQGREANKEFEENQKRKEEVIAKINALANAKESDVDAFLELQEEYESIGFVPRNAIAKIKNAYSEAVDRFLEKAETLSDEEKERLRLQNQISRIKSAPDSDRKLRHKENNIRRQISKIENDISIWNNNLEFFASSKNADKLKNDFTEKINEAQAELEKLREQLKIVVENE